MSSDCVCSHQVSRKNLQLSVCPSTWWLNFNRWCKMAVYKSQEWIGHRVARVICPMAFPNFNHFRQKMRKKLYNRFFLIKQLIKNGIKYYFKIWLAFAQCYFKVGILIKKILSDKIYEIRQKLSSTLTTNVSILSLLLNSYKFLIYTHFWEYAKDSRFIKDQYYHESI